MSARVLQKATPAAPSKEMSLSEYTPFGDDAPLDTGDAEESEQDFNRKMALEAYDDLREGNEFVTYDQFMEWDDIKEVLDRNIDMVTLLTILMETKAIKEELPFSSSQEGYDMVESRKVLADTIFTFDEFFESIDMINPRAMRQIRLQSLLKL
jgi:hypothetical protein